MQMIGNTNGKFLRQYEQTTVLQLDFQARICAELMHPSRFHNAYVLGNLK